MSDQARYDQWQEIHVSEIWAVEYGVSERPFRADIEAIGIGEVVVGQMAGTITSANRTKAHVAADGADDVLLLINRSEHALAGTQVGRSCAIGLGQAALVSASDPLVMKGGDRNRWSNIVLPRRLLASRMKDIDARLARPIDADNEALRLLDRYCAFLQDDIAISSPELMVHIQNTIVDLIAIATDGDLPRRDAPVQTGLRAARTQAILADIEGAFTRPHVSAHTVGAGLGLSARYVQDLLSETGSTFAERVLDLRLRKARDLLSDPRCAGLKVSEIALQVGFSDISYFNRSFRRRYGVTPNSVR